MIVPPSDLAQGLLAIWPYLLGAVGVALAIGFAVPISKKKHEDPTKTIVREEIQNDVKIVTRVHKQEVAIPYDVWLKLLSDYERTKEESQKKLLTQLALLEAKKEEERDKLLRDLTNPDAAYRDLVKVKTRKNGKPKEKEEEDVDLDTSEIYADQA